MHCFTVHYDMDSSDSEGSSAGSSSSDDAEGYQLQEDTEAEAQQAGVDKGSGVTFPLVDLYDGLHQLNRHRLVSGGKKGRGTKLLLQVLGNSKHSDVVLQPELQMLTKNIYIFLKETYPGWFDQVQTSPNLCKCFQNLANVCKCCQKV